MNIKVQALSLASELLNKKLNEHGEFVLNHSKRLADKAVLLHFDDILIAACYLHETLAVNYDTFYENYEFIRDIDENLAKIVDKCTKKHTESLKQYYKRVNDVP